MVFPLFLWGVKLQHLRVSAWEVLCKRLRCANLPTKQVNDVVDISRPQSIPCIWERRHKNPGLCPSGLCLGEDFCWCRRLRSIESTCYQEGLEWQYNTTYRIWLKLNIWLFVRNYQYSWHRRGTDGPHWARQDVWGSPSWNTQRRRSWWWNLPWRRLCLRHWLRMRSLKYSLLDFSGMFKFLVRTSVNVFMCVNCLLPDRILQGELIVGVGFRDELRGVATVVASQQHDALRRVPGRVSQSGLLQCGGVRLPSLSWLG